MSTDGTAVTREEELPLEMVEARVRQLATRIDELFVRILDLEGANHKARHDRDALLAEFKALKAAVQALHGPVAELVALMKAQVPRA